MTPLIHLLPYQILNYLGLSGSVHCLVDLTWQDALPPSETGAVFTHPGSRLHRLWNALTPTGDGTLFAADRSYCLNLFPIAVQRTIKPSAGSVPDHEHVLTANDIGFAVSDNRGNVWLFVSRRHVGEGCTITGILANARTLIHPHFAIETLVEKFSVPSPPGIPSARPEQLQVNLRFLDAIEKLANDGFRFKPIPRNGPSPQLSRARARGEPISKSAPCPVCGWSKCCCGSGASARVTVSLPAPQNFALDMVRVDVITKETEEVAGVLAGIMQDEPEKAISTPKTPRMVVPELSKSPSDSDSAPLPSLFEGLDAAFKPVLERLLTRDSWPPADFNALSREFELMPLCIRDTLNEWADEALGDFILEGEDPVVVRRECPAARPLCNGVRRASQQTRQRPPRPVRR
jgi:hypothetical protein